MVADEIVEMLRLKASLLVRRSMPELTGILDPSFVYINARGERFDRDGYVAAFCGSDGIRFHSQSFDDVQVQDFGTFAVATMDVHDTLEFEGKVWSGVVRSLCVFRRSGERWLWCAGQTMALAS